MVDEINVDAVAGEFASASTVTKYADLLKLINDQNAQIKEFEADPELSLNLIPALQQLATYYAQMKTMYDNGELSEAVMESHFIKVWQFLIQSGMANNQQVIPENFSQANFDVLKNKTIQFDEFHDPTLLSQLLDQGESITSALQTHSQMTLGDMFLQFGKDFYISFANNLDALREKLISTKDTLAALTQITSVRNLIQVDDALHIPVTKLSDVPDSLAIQFRDSIANKVDPFANPEGLAALAKQADDAPNPDRATVLRRWAGIIKASDDPKDWIDPTDNSSIIVHLVNEIYPKQWDEVFVDTYIRSQLSSTPTLVKQTLPDNFATTITPTTDLSVVPQGALDDFATKLLDASNPNSVRGIYNFFLAEGGAPTDIEKLQELIGRLQSGDPVVRRQAILDTLTDTATGINYSFFNNPLPDGITTIRDGFKSTLDSSIHFYYATNSDSGANVAVKIVKQRDILIKSLEDMLAHHEDTSENSAYSTISKVVEDIKIQFPLDKFPRNDYDNITSQPDVATRTYNYILALNTHKNESGTNLETAITANQNLSDRQGDELKIKQTQQQQIWDVILSLSDAIKKAIESAASKLNR